MTNDSNDSTNQTNSNNSTNQTNSTNIFDFLIKLIPLLKSLPLTKFGLVLFTLLLFGCFWLFKSNIMSAFDRSEVDKNKPSTKNSPNSLEQEITWNGVYKDVKKDSNNPEKFTSIIATEEIKLTFSENTVKGNSKAVGRESDNQSWEQIGYKNDDHLVLAYRNKNTGIPGIGTYFLERHGNSNKTYIGYWEGLDCDLKKVFHCPYVLSQENINRIESDFKNYLEKQCQIVDSEPNLSSCG